MKSGPAVTLPLDPPQTTPAAKLLRDIQRTDNKKEISSLAEKLRERELTINSLNEQLQLPTNQNPNLPEPKIPTSPLAASPDLQQPPELQTTSVFPMNGNTQQSNY